MRLFDVLLRAFPAAFRQRFAEGMRYAFREELGRARERGTAWVVWLWIRTTGSVVYHGLAERISGRGEGMGTMTRELRQAIRRLVRRPVFSLTALATLALGIGGTTAIFSVIESVILRPLPYEDGGRLVSLGHESATDRLGMPAGGYLHYEDASRTVEQMALWYEVSAPVAGMGEPMELGSIHGSRSLLPTLGVEPVLGRGFVAEDHEPGAAPVAIVSHDFWVRHMGADPDAVGGPLLPGSSEIVVGVLPEGFDFLRPEAVVVFGNRFDGPDVYYPLEALDGANANFGNFIYHGVGRLAPGATVEGAQREFESLMYAATEAYPGGITPQRLTEEGFRPRVRLLKDELVGDVAGVLWILLGAVAFVLVIALANVANLLLVRAEARAGEIAVRRAMGAGGGAIGLSYASESAVLAVLGGLAGTVLAGAGTTALLELVPADVPRLELVGINGTVLAFALGLSLLTAVLLSLVPTLGAGDADLRDRLGDGGRSGATGGRRHRVRQGLLVSQVAFSLVLLIGSTLLFTSFRNLQEVDPGFDPENVLTLRLPLSGSILSAAGFTEGPGDRRRSDFMLAVVDRVSSLPGVTAAAFSADLPLDGDEWHDDVATEDAWPAEAGGGTQTQRVFMGPGYLSTLGATLVQGRDFDRQDFAGQPRVAVVNETFAEQRWPGEDPLGRRIAQYHHSVSPEDDVFYTVVGVVDDIRETSLMAPPEATVYLPTIFLPEGNFGMFVSNMVLVVRTDGDPGALLPAVREEILAFRPDVPIKDVATLQEVTASSFGEVRFAMALIGIAAGMSLLLGIVGIYGSVSYVVAQRTREFGLRIALGASGRDVSRGVLRRAVAIGVQGLVVGLAAALAGAGLLESMLFGVSAGSPAVYASVAGALLTVVLVASFVPARRAARVDPMVAMRAE